MLDYGRIQLLEKDIAQGYLCTPVDGQPRVELGEVMVQTGKFLRHSLRDCGKIKLLSLEEQELCTIRTIPLRGPVSTCNDPRTILEETIQAGLVGESITIASSNQRDQLFVSVLPVCARLRRLTHGSHTATSHITVAPGFEGFKKEDFNCQSSHFLHEGNPRIWLIVAPRHTEKLEAYITGLLNITPHCSQFISHQHALVAPSVLHTWGIQFTIQVQHVGNVLLLDYNVYFYTFDTGTNALEKNSWCDETWLLPPTYRLCSSTCDQSNPDEASPMFYHQSDGHPKSTPHSSSLMPNCQDSGEVATPGNGQDTAAAERGLSVLSDDDFPSSLYHRSTLTLPGHNGPSNTTNVYPGDSAVHAVDLHTGLDPNSSSESVMSQQPMQAESAARNNEPSLITEDLDLEQTTNTSPGSAASNNEQPTAITDPAHDSSLVSAKSSDSLVSLSSGSSPAAVNETALLFTEIDAEEGSLHKVLKSLHENGSASDICDDINRLVAYGIKYQDLICWPFREQPANIPHMLQRFRPNLGTDSWLNGDGVNQVLGALVKGRHGVMLVDTYKVASLMRQSGFPEWMPLEAVDYVLLPVNRGNLHWVLVHLDIKQHSIVVHERTTNPEAEWVLCAMKQRMPGWDWTLDTRGTVKNPNHTECGIILLAAAENLVTGANPAEQDFREQDFLALRKKYLGMLLAPTLCEFDNVQRLQRIAPTSAAEPDEDQISWCPTDPGSQDIAVDDRDYLRILASAVGCATVLRDLEIIVKSSTLFNQSISHIDMAMNMFMVGSRYCSLGWVQKDTAALVIASKFNLIKSQVLNQRQITKKGGQRGIGVDTLVYNKLIGSCSRRVKESSLRRSIKAANYRGQKLLVVSEICGPGRPLWLFFPTRSLQAPLRASYTVNPWQYRELTLDDMRTLVDLVRETRGEFWEHIPRLCEEILGTRYQVEPVQQ